MSINMTSDMTIAKVREVIDGRVLTTHHPQFWEVTMWDGTQFTVNGSWEDVEFIVNRRFKEALGVN